MMRTFDTSADLEAYGIEDFAIPCESGVHQDPVGSNDPAEWVVWLVPCCPNRPKYALVCDPCLQWVLDDNNNAECSRCTEIYKPARLSITHFERIDNTHPKPPA